MKPAWDGVMEKYKDSKTVLVADVDCTAAGKPLCSANGVNGYPTIKHGDPSALEDYKGGRDAASLEAFAAELGPSCSPNFPEECGEEARKELDALMALSDEEIEAKIAEGDKKIEDAESTFKTELEKLQEAYQKLMTTKDDTIAEVKKSGLGQLKSVRAFRKNAAKNADAKDEL
jgi:hypothetical protein